MLKLFKKSLTWAISVITIVFTFVPETAFGKCKLLLDASDEANVVLMRVLTFIAVFILSIAINALHVHFRKSLHIKGNNYSIQIEYGNILEMRDCKKVINFDECFTTSVGSAPSDINSDSLCGQFLEANSIEDIQKLIGDAELIPLESKSKYQSKNRYASGKLVPYEDFLLMAFAKLDKKGLGVLSREEFVDCLSTLWEEIDKYYGQKDVCIPVLGSGITRGELRSLTQQELLDIIIGSYKLSIHKIKVPCKLHIVCRKRDGFSLNKIGELV